LHVTVLSTTTPARSLAGQDKNRADDLRHPLDRPAAFCFTGEANGWFKAYKTTPCQSSLAVPDDVASARQRAPFVLHVTASNISSSGQSETPNRRQALQQHHRLHSRVVPLALRPLLPLYASMIASAAGQRRGSGLNLGLSVLTLRRARAK